MLIEIILFLFLGIAAGTFTGLIPGIHINLIGILLISLISLPLFASINTIYFVVFITSMAITHTFVDFIPSIFLGCPDTDTELSILPGHELLKEGLGHEAVVISAYGSLFAIFFLLIIIIPSIYIIPLTNKFIEKIIPYFLIIISIGLILIENNKFKALFAFTLSGILGWLVLGSNQELINQPLLPLLTGLFGSSSLLISIKNKTIIPKQIITKKIRIHSYKPLLGALIASPLCSFLPGLGSGQAAIIGNQLSKIHSSDKRGFILLLGATNTLVMGFSFLSLYLISKTRTGAAVAINNLIGIPSTKLLILIIFAITFSGIFSFFLTIKISKIISRKIEKINYQRLSILTIIFLTFLVTIFTGLLGLLIFIISTLIGVYCISLGVRRTNLMGCLLIPTIIFYLI